MHRAELGPTRIAPLADLDRSPVADATVLVEVDQSDEGGRFLHDNCRYRVVLRDVRDEVPDDTVRLTLGEAQDLLARGGTLTNEARSALALLLCWL